MQFAFMATRLLSNLSTRTINSFFSEVPSHLLSPSPWCCVELLHPRCMTSHLFCWTSWGFCWPGPPGCLRLFPGGVSEWGSLVVSQLSPSTRCHSHTCWGWAFSWHRDCQWRCYIVSVSVSACGKCLQKPAPVSLGTTKCYPLSLTIQPIFSCLVHLSNFPWEIQGKLHPPALLTCR